MRDMGLDFVDYCFQKTNEMQTTREINVIKDKVNKKIKEVSNLSTEKFHVIYREDTKRLIDKQRLQEYTSEGGICLQSFIRPAINSYGQLVGCGKYEEQANPKGKSILGDAKTTPFEFLWEREKKKLISFKSIYCTEYGPCYFTGFNYKISWVINQIKKNPRISFSRALIENGKIIRLYDSLLIS